MLFLLFVLACKINLMSVGHAIPDTSIAPMNAGIGATKKIEKRPIKNTLHRLRPKKTTAIATAFIDKESETIKSLSKNP